MTTTDPASVVASYDQRTCFASAEAQHAPVPAALPGLLATAEHVGELPCAGGHHLDLYAAAGCRVTLVDANRDMLTVAMANAARAGIAAGRCDAIAAFVQGLPELDVDLLIVPNAAVNQLGCQLDLAALFSHLVEAVPAGTQVLAPLLCSRANGSDPSAMYDPHAVHGQWFTDRTFAPPAGEAVRRLRRQDRDATTVRLDFDYRSRSNISLHRTSVTLQVYSPAEVLAACRAAGLIKAHLSVGDRLSELTATTGDPW